MILAALAWVCLAGAALAQVQAQAPAPAAASAPVSSALVFPPLTGRVVDQAGLLPPQDQAAISDALAALEATTSSQVVVATVKSLQGRDIADYGYQLGRFWKIGQKDTNTGALLIVAPTERAVRIEVGYGLEGVLTDAATRVIIESTILPAFRTGDYPTGIKRGTAQIIQLLRGDASAVAKPVQHVSRVQTGGIPLWAIIACGVVFVFLLIHCAVSGGVLCQIMTQMAFMAATSSGRGGSGGSGPSFGGGGGSFGGGGSSGKW